MDGAFTPLNGVGSGMPTGFRTTLVPVPTIRQIQEALAKQAPEELEDSEPPRAPPVREALRLSPDVIRFRAEKDAAPLVARDALLDVLAEARATTRLARWTLLVAAVTLLVSVASITIALLG